jgi:sugar/nucleoside kinase (ribokinase family)
MNSQGKSAGLLMCGATASNTLAGKRFGLPAGCVTCGADGAHCCTDWQHCCASGLPIPVRRDTTGSGEGLLAALPRGWLAG